MNEMNYIQEVQKRVDEEYNAFKEELLTKTPEEVFYHGFEIYVKTELHEALQDDDYFSEKIYRLLYEVGEGLLNFLYDEFISDEFASVNTYDDTARFIIQDTMEYMEQEED